MNGRQRTADVLGRVAEYALYILAALIPLAIIPSERFIIWEPPKVALLNVLTFVALAAWFNGMAWSGRLQVRLPPFFVPVMAYFNVYLLATVFSFSPVLSIFGIVDRSMGIITLTNLVLLYFLAFNILTGRGQQIRCLKIIIFSASAVSVLGVLQYSGVELPYLLPYGKGERTGATLGNADYCIPVLVLSIPLAATFLLKRRFLYAVPLTLLLAMLLIALPVPDWTGGWPVNSPREAEATPAVSAEIQPANLVLIEEQEARPSPVSRAVTFLSRAAEERVQTRLGMWEAGIKAVEAHPFLGTGPNTYRNVFTAYEPLYYVRYLPSFREDKIHNEFIEVAQSTGLVGLAAYTWMLVAALWFFLRRTLRQRDGSDVLLVAAILVGTAGYLAYTAMLFHTIAAYTLFWMLLGVGAGLCGYSGPQVDVKFELPRPVLGSAVLASGAAVALVGLLAVRPVFAEISSALAKSVIITDVRSQAETAEWFCRAADLAPYQTEYLRTAARSLADLGAVAGGTPGAAAAFQKSFSYINRAIRQEPYSAPLYYDRAIIQLRAGRSKDVALNDLNKAIEMYPYYIYAYNLRADVARSQGQYDKAIVDRQKALFITPEDTNIMVEIGYDGIGADRYAEAIGILERAVAAGDKNARTRFLLGGAYELSGNRAKAREAYLSTLAVDAKYAPARAGLSRLEVR